jgi:hypothetical protein
MRTLRRPRLSRSPERVVYSVTWLSDDRPAVKDQPRDKRVEGGQGGALCSALDGGSPEQTELRRESERAQPPISRPSGAVLQRLTAKEKRRSLVRN